jgi:hypothetical protein
LFSRLLFNGHDHDWFHVLDVRDRRFLSSGLFSLLDGLLLSWMFNRMFEFSNGYMLHSMLGNMLHSMLGNMLYSMLGNMLYRMLSNMLSMLR